jgi:hypothetical protein
MGIFGWDLPPGCSVRDLPGNRPEEQAEEAFFDLVYEQFPATMSEDDKEKLAAWMWEQVGKAYGDGYQQATADSKQAEEYNG